MEPLTRKRPPMTEEGCMSGTVLKRHRIHEAFQRLDLGRVDTEPHRSKISAKQTPFQVDFDIECDFDSQIYEDESGSKILEDASVIELVHKAQVATWMAGSLCADNSLDPVQARMDQLIRQSVQAASGQMALVVFNPKIANMFGPLKSSDVSDGDEPPCEIEMTHEESGSVQRGEISASGSIDSKYRTHQDFENTLTHCEFFEDHKFSGNVSHTEWFRDCETEPEPAQMRGEDGNIFFDDDSDL